MGVTAGSEKEEREVERSVALRDLTTLGVCLKTRVRVGWAESGRGGEWDGWRVGWAESGMGGE